MNAFKNTRLIIPAILFVLGVFIILNPETDGKMKAFWWGFTPVALCVGVLRFILLKKQNKSVDTDEGV